MSAHKTYNRSVVFFQIESSLNYASNGAVDLVPRVPVRAEATELELGDTGIWRVGKAIGAPVDAVRCDAR